MCERECGGVWGCKWVGVLVDVSVCVRMCVCVFFVFLHGLAHESGLMWMYMFP